VGKEWSHTWDESALKYLRNEQNMISDLSSYTSPKTPSSKIGNCNTPTSMLTHDKVSSQVPIFTNENTQQTQELYSELSKKSEIIEDSNINNSTNLKPKVICLKNVKIPLEKHLPKDYTLRKENGKNNRPGIGTEIISCKNNANFATSLVSNITSIKDNQSTDTLPKMNVVKERSKEGLKLSVRKIKRTGFYEKFDFEELMKPTSTNTENKCKLDLPKIHREDEKSELNLKDDNVLLKSKDTNGELENGDMCGTSIISSEGSQPNLNSILALSNSSKDSGVDQDLVEKEDLNLQLDELLAGFSNNDNGLDKNNVNNANEYDWIDSLFE
jgi:hypothetical protein